MHTSSLQRPSVGAGSGGLIRLSAGQRVNLLAGQACFGRDAARVKTLLGSCVAITLWHPERRIGGMCHFLLPERVRATRDPLDARFGTEAVEMLVHALRAAGTQPPDYVCHLYGGADTLPDQMGKSFNVGERNIAHGWALIEQCGFNLHDVDVGDTVPRTVELALDTGDVMIRRGQAMKGTR